MGAVTVRLAGSFEVRLDGSQVAVRGKARLLLVLLAAGRHRAFAADGVVDALWDGCPPRRPAENVATLISRLRGALGAEVIIGGREGYRLGPPPAVRVDLDEAAGLVDEARHRLAHQPALAAAAATRAVELLGAGGVLVGEADTAWVVEARSDGDRLLREARHLTAEAVLSTGDLHAARVAAGAAIATDRFDELAVRLLMAAHRAAGEPQRALAAYERLRGDLAGELGVDPAPQTREAHVAVLRERDSPATARPVRPAPERANLVGRVGELAELTAAWSRACVAEPGVLLLAGEGGIGKTRLAAEVASLAEETGGLVLRSRCYAGERSLALQPFVDALAPSLTALSGDRLRELAGPRAAALSGLMPQLESALGRPDQVRGSAELELRRIYEAITHVLGGLAADRPALLVLDDLHNAGLATAELLHYLARQVRGVRLLVLATVRAEEGEAVLDTLADVTERLDLGPLAPAAVATLAAEAGQAEQAATILRRTRGHTLFVVETLRGWAAGDTGPPDTLQAVVLARLRRTGPATEEVLRAAAVLGATVDPTTVAELLDLPPLQVAQRCELAARARLLVTAGPGYEFANDLVQEVLYASIAAPTRLAYHARAADLLDGAPEAVAVHALAAGRWSRAAAAFLQAAEDATARFAAADAEVLAGRALDAAQRGTEPAPVARALLARGRSRLVRAWFRGAFDDQRAGLDVAREAGDRVLELVALRELGGHAAVATNDVSISECTGWLGEGLALAESLDDHGMQAKMLGWLGVISSNRLRFDEALGYARRAVSAGRAARDDAALAAGLDGMKNAHAYLGELGPLQTVLDELEPLLRRLGDPELLQWAVFESAFPAVGAGDWTTAEARIAEAVQINRRSGPAGHDAWFLAHLGWLARLQGRHDDALGYGRRALAVSRRSPHRWMAPGVAAQLATTLLELGHAAEAARLLAAHRGQAEQEGAEASLLRCLAPLAEATGAPDVLAEAEALLARVRTPPGTAWLLGTDCYLAVARAWLARGEPGRARAVLAPLLVSVDRHGWLPARAAGALVAGRAAATLDPAGP